MVLARKVMQQCKPDGRGGAGKVRRVDSHSERNLDFIVGLVI